MTDTAADARLHDDPLACLLDPPPALAAADVASWWRDEQARRRARPDAGSFERAVAGGLAADRLGWALASGFQASLDVLVPGLRQVAPEGGPVAFCVSEAGGNSPKAIRTSLVPDGDGYRLSGEKHWATLGPAAGMLLVAACESVAAGACTATGAGPAADAEAAGGMVRPSIRLVRIAADAPGLAFVPMPEADFVPEVPHARLRLDAVRIEPDAILPGDAYERFIKPFRTIEDVLVTAAELSYLLAEAGRRDWPRAWRERALAALAGLEALALRDPRANATHIVLAGALAGWRGLEAEAGEFFATGPADAAASRWARDSRMFGIGFGARAVRTERAWQRATGAA